MKLPRWICHQRPERCFEINGKPMILCSRCFGLYLFIAIGFLFPLIVEFINILDTKPLLILTIILTLPFFIDSATQFLGWRKSNNSLRFITGSLAGIILGIDIYYIILYFIQKFQNYSLYCCCNCTSNFYSSFYTFPNIASTPIYDVSS